MKTTRTTDNRQYFAMTVAVLLMGTVGLQASEITLGASRQAVLEAYGSPSGCLTVGQREYLYYGQSHFEITNNRVSQMALSATDKERLESMDAMIIPGESRRLPAPGGVVRRENTQPAAAVAPSPQPSLPRVVLKAMEDARSEDAHLRVQGLRTLKTLGPRAAAVLPDLVSMLEVQKETIRCADDTTACRLLIQAIGAVGLRAGSGKLSRELSVLESLVASDDNTTLSVEASMALDKIRGG